MPCMSADEFIDHAGSRPGAFVERSTYRQMRAALNECGFSRNMRAGLIQALDPVPTRAHRSMVCGLFEAERVGLLHALDVDAEAAQIGHEVLVTAFDVVDSRDFGDSPGAQSGHDETCSRTDVRGLDLGAGEAVGAGHKRVVAIDAHLGTEARD